LPHSVHIQLLAAEVGGVFDVAVANRKGIPTWAVDHERDIGRIVAMFPGVYRPAAVPPTPMLWLRAAVLAGGPQAHASHRSAAWMLDWPGGRGDLCEIVVPHDHRPRLRGVTVHRTYRLPDAHRRVVDGLPVTSVDRTLADLGAVVRPDVVQAAVETAVVRRLTTVDRLWELIDDHGRKGRNGIGALRLALEEWMLSERPPDSVLEIAFARLVKREGLPEPDYQRWVEVGGRRYRIDAAWPDQMLAVEVDGWETRKTYRAFQSDTDRQNAITLAGWQFIRFTWTDVVRRPAYVARQIAEALGLLRPDSGPSA
jgi:very-short-patch-repair endonuclease